MCVYVISYYVSPENPEEYTVHYKIFMFSKLGISLLKFSSPCVQVSFDIFHVSLREMELEELVGMLILRLLLWQ